MHENLKSGTAAAQGASTKASHVQTQDANAETILSLQQIIEKHNEQMENLMKHSEMAVRSMPKGVSIEGVMNMLHDFIGQVTAKALADKKDDGGKKDTEAA